jgi:hypothetical protein
MALKILIVDDEEPARQGLTQLLARWAAVGDGRTMQLGRVAGCHTVRHIIVCSEEDVACLGHEERHRAEGAFHP